MVFINEWLPNPTGTDAKGEFVELFNNGDASVSLRGWNLKASGKKIASLDTYSISPNGYLLLKKTETKLSLKNSDETILLYDAAGKLADQSSFKGAAQEGQSLSRINYGTDTSEHFAWSTPTPGAVNKISIHTSLSANVYPFDVPINQYSSGWLSAFSAAICVGAILAAFVIYFLRTNEEISKFIFPGDGSLGG